MPHSSEPLTIPIDFEGFCKLFHPGRVVITVLVIGHVVKNTFYIVFLDGDHDFWDSPKKTLNSFFYLSTKLLAHDKKKPQKIQFGIQGQGSFGSDQRDKDTSRVVHTI
jgi:hypothetical protein